MNLFKTVNNIVEQENILEKKKIKVLTLYKILNNKDIFPYFKDMYQDKIRIIKGNNEYKIMTEKFNNIRGETNRMLNNVIVSLSVEDSYEDQFFFEDCNNKYESYTSKRVIDALKDYQKIIKESNSIEEFNKIVKEKIEKDGSYIFYIANMYNKSNEKEYFYFKNLLNDIKIKNKIDSVINSRTFHSDNLFEKSLIDNDITNNMFKEYKPRYEKHIQEILSNIKDDNELLEKEKPIINKILKKVLNEYPELISPPNTENITINYLETDNDKESSFYFETKELNCIDKTFKTKLKSATKDDNAIDFIHGDNSYILKNTNNSLSLEGMFFVREKNLKNPQDKMIFFIAKNKEETVGVLSIKKESNDNLFKIHEICVKSSYRRLNVPRLLYKELAKFSIDNELIITNSNYTNDGKRALPSIKEIIKKENPNFILLDRIVSDPLRSESKNQLIEKRNNYLLMLLRKNIDYKEVLKIYTNTNKLINENKPKTHLEEKELQKKIKDEMDTLNKKNKKKLQYKI